MSTRKEFERWAIDEKIVLNARSAKLAWLAWQAGTRVEREACADLRGEMSPLDAMQGEEVGSAAMVRVAERAYGLYEDAIRKRGGTK